MFRKIKNYFQIRRDISRLSQLSDRDLADIGVKRSEICFLVKGKK